MEHIIAPVTLDEFHSTYALKKPMLISRNSVNPSYYSGWLSTDRVRELVNTEGIEWGADYSVHKYNVEKDQRDDFDKQALGPLDMFDNGGCSIRFYSPQKLDRHIWSLTAMFEEYWGSVAGNNIYYTPKGEQGFAPHWDDVDAYLLQISGKKVWRLWPPPNGCENPRYYSEDFKYEDLDEETYSFEVEAGELLYIPRGWIHAGVCTDQDSLHMTLSIYYRHSWADLMRIFAETAIKHLEQKDSRLREGLPRDMMSVLGVQPFLDLGSPFKKVQGLSAEDIGMRGREGPFSINPASLVVTSSHKKLSKNSQKKQVKVDAKRQEEGAVSDEEDVEELKTRRACISHHLRTLFGDMLGMSPKFGKAVEGTLDALPLDESADKIANQFTKKRIPTVLPLYLQEGYVKRVREDHSVDKEIERELSRNDEIRLLQPTVLHYMNRPIPTIDAPQERQEEETIILESNSSCNHKKDNDYSLELPLRVMGALKYLQSSWPSYVRVSDLPIVPEDGDLAVTDADVGSLSQEERVILAEELLREGVLDIKGVQL